MKEEKKKHTNLQTDQKTNNKIKKDEEKLQTTICM